MSKKKKNSRASRKQTAPAVPQNKKNKHSSVTRKKDYVPAVKKIPSDADNASGILPEDIAVSSVLPTGEEAPAVPGLQIPDGPDIAEEGPADVTSGEEPEADAPSYEDQSPETGAGADSAETAGQEATAETADASGEESPSDGTDEKPSPLRRKRVKTAVCLALALALAFAWYLTRPRFKDVTVELGTESVSITEFMTFFANGRKVSFVTDPSTIDLDTVGTTEVTLRHGKREETVLFSVVDTTAPEVVFAEQVESSLSSRPSPEDFIVSVNDLSPVTASFAEPLENVSDYGKHEVRILVTDAYGNVTEGICTVSYVWLKEALTVEYGTPITQEDILLDPDPSYKLVSRADLDMLNSADLGTYVIESSQNGETMKCTVTIQDTTPPVLRLRDVTIILTQKATMDSFITEASDNYYKNVILTMKTSLVFDRLGYQTVTIEARDVNGNVTVGTAKLRIKEDDVAPTFSGVGELEVSKHSTPDYREGVSATDNIDGTVPFTVDASGVDTDKAGTYFVTYTAKDARNNVATVKRTVTVLHDYEDTRALCEEFYAMIPDHSPTGISNFIRGYIGYNSSWGGSDPIWYGLTNLTGNCYVHAKILGEMLSRAGYSNQLIWTTDQSHYWNLVYAGGWHHIDSTPSSRHPAYLMNDETRFANLQGRDWDRESWPECL